MNFIDLIASEIYKAVHPDTIPDNRNLALYRLYAVLLLVKGTGVTAEDVHNAWSAWACEYDPKNQNILPFNELSLYIQEKDGIYVQAIHDVANHMPLNGSRA